MCAPRPPAWLPSVALAWLVGSAWQLQQPSLSPRVGQPVWWLAALAGVLVWVLLAWVLTRRAGSASGRVDEGPHRFSLLRAWAARGVVWLAAGALAFGLTEWRAAQRLEQALAPAWEGVDLQVEGRVQGLPRFSSEGVSFEVAVTSAIRDGQPVPVPPQVALSWFRGFDGESLVAEPPRPVRAGDTWRWTVRLKRPHGLMNPNGFDLEAWLFARGLGATGAVRGEAVFLGSSGQERLDRWRQTLRDGLLQRGAGPTDAAGPAQGDAGRSAPAAAAGVLAALSVGDQSSIDQAGWELFRITGISHLMSVSGLHVTMWAWIAALAVGALWSRSALLVRRCPAPVAARWGGLLLALAYALLAGWGVPAQRTVWMLAVVCVAASTGRRWPAPWVLLMAAWVVVLLDPWALLQVGFWLSFAAVALLIWSSDGQQAVALLDIRAQMRAAVRTQWLATVGLAPLTLCLFQQFSVVGLLANLWAIPWVTLVVTPLAMLSAVWPPVQPVAEASVGVLWALLQPLASVPWAQWTAAAPGWPLTVAGVLGGGLAVAPVPLRLRLCGACLILPMVLARPDAPPWGEVRLLAMDVGQGTAFWVQTQRHRLLYDAGPVYGSGPAAADAGSRVVLPWWRSQGEPVIDTLVLSHRDTDHTGGARTLLAQAKVRGSLTSLEDGHPLLAHLPAHRRCEAGHAWVWDGVRFEVVHPTAEHHGRGGPPNGLSCVIRVIDRHGPRVLLTGDIEAAQEAELVAKAPGTLRASVLMLPHHGSKTSSTPAFLNAVQARIVIAQAAYRSRFGHPAPVVTDRLRALGWPLRQSSVCGAWSWPAQTGGHPSAAAADGDLGVCERDRRRRYWHHPGEP